MFLFASVVVIENPGVEIYDGCPTQRCYVRDLWWEGSHNRSMTYNGLVHTKMLRTCNGIAYTKKKKKMFVVEDNLWLGFELKDEFLLT